MNCKIAVCDDEPVICKTIYTMITALSDKTGIRFEIDCFTSGEELCRENTDSGHAAEDAEIEDEEQLVDDGDPGHRIRADPPDHNVVQHTDKIRDTVLQHDRKSDHHRMFDKLSVKPDTQSSPFFQDIQPTENRQPADRRRDLNPRAAINDLHPFQGCPFGQLGYFSKMLELTNNM